MKIYYKKGYKYQLAKNMEFNVPFLHSVNYSCRYFALQGNKLYLFEGYAWDGASGPTFDTKSTMRASAVHDVIYQLIAYDILSESVRPEADKLLHDLMIEDGAWEWRSKLWLKVLKLFGRPQKKKIHVAP